MESSSSICSFSYLKSSIEFQDKDKTTLQNARMPTGEDIFLSFSLSLFNLFQAMENASSMTPSYDITPSSTPVTNATTDPSRDGVSFVVVSELQTRTTVGNAHRWRKTVRVVQRL